mmetsp:Transcript_5736/g.12505  ORF Transcript_5736/g.12505 Transcript_5736/m.12505 type:complete len:208 (-) Transcript_5736:1478-2101(-)
MALGAVRHGVETAPDTASSLHCTHGARKAHASAAHMTTETHGQTHRMRARLRRRELHVTSRSGGHSQRSTCATSLTAIAIHNGCHQRRLPLTTIAIHTRLISASIERIPERKACLAIKLIDGLALWLPPEGLTSEDFLHERNEARHRIRIVGGVVRRLRVLETELLGGIIVRVPLDVPLAGVLLNLIPQVLVSTTLVQEIECGEDLV